jgi:lipoate-protein ligase A
MPSSSGTWQLFVEPFGRSGRENMAFDQALLDEAARSGTAFLHLYAWRPACLSLGRNEPALRRYDREAIERLGIDVVRRPTGGRAVWHSQEVTYAVAAPVAEFGSLRESHLAIHQRLAAALRLLGVPAALANSGESRYRLDGGACYALALGGEVVVRGRKLVGSAQVRQGDAFLQHGSILLDGSQDVVAAVSREWAGVSDHTTLSAELDRGVPFAEVVDAICDTWPDALTSPNLYPPPPISNHADLPVWRG